ncbi:hypothetical protein [Streptomyces sp. NPDC058603]|uniref:hypothetical protein n=1 Tax=Streptomyces sp. NPDC058603 TaxID=3346551 RepID=UPI0036583222
MYLTPHGRTRNTQGNQPIFIERSGKRRRIVRFAAIALGGACGAYLMFVAIVIAGLWLPAGQQTPTDERGYQQVRPPSPLPDGSLSPHPAEATRG